MKKLHTWFL